ncbi:hypothetical protein ACJIZ3_011529 [Penstemon smallii]|uniref:Uncharacterized protein n=1 Tax=Penstemon smallii TaxID=265156 RepID=A0ABD3UJJ0_9LAMI
MHFTPYSLICEFQRQLKRKDWKEPLYPNEKVMLLMETGLRLHTPAYMGKRNTPSGFTLKLRKHIRTRGCSSTWLMCTVILEQGNIILTDSEFTGLPLLRSHRDDDKGVAIMSRHHYPVELSRVFERTRRDKIEHGNDSSDANIGKQGNMKNVKSTDSARAKAATLKVVLGEALGYGPALSEHIILDAGLLPSTKVSKDFNLVDITIQVLGEAVARSEDWLAYVISGEKEPEGYVLMEQVNSGKRHDAVYEKGTSEKFKSRDSIKFETFDAALDEFYSKIESQQHSEQQRNWIDLGRMVEGKKSGNPVNCITLLLSNDLDEMDDDEKTQPADKVEVGLALSAHANGRLCYEIKTKQESKQEKTITAHEKAFKAAERKTRKQLLQVGLLFSEVQVFSICSLCRTKTVSTISHIRKVHWFEKFNWSISGRDAQQNEMIVKHYMHVHAELHGALSTVIKNHKPKSPVPPLTLNQAGCITMRSGVCPCQAWDSKIVTSAWWVYPNQVTKTAPSGDYLTIGSFVIRGIRMHPLIYGSLGSHMNERRERGEEEGINDAEQSEHFKEISDSGSDSEKEIPDQKAMLEPSGLEDLSKEPTGKDFSSMTNVREITSMNYVDSDKVSEASGQASDAVNSNLEDLIDKALELGSAATAVKKYGFHASQKEHDHKKKAQKGHKDGASGGRAEEDKGAEEYPDIESQPDEIKSSKPSIGEGSRGQIVKLKKKKENYADQDEEQLLANRRRNVKATEENEVKLPSERETNYYLTGNPLPNDVLLYGLPVCGPYNALPSYKYRVKIIPASLKKGEGLKLKLRKHKRTRRHEDVRQHGYDRVCFAHFSGFH